MLKLNLNSDSFHYRLYQFISKADYEREYKPKNFCKYIWVLLLSPILAPCAFLGHYVAEKHKEYKYDPPAAVGAAVIFCALIASYFAICFAVALGMLIGKAILGSSAAIMILSFLVTLIICLALFSYSDKFNFQRLKIPISKLIVFLKKLCPSITWDNHD